MQEPDRCVSLEAAAAASSEMEQDGVAWPSLRSRQQREQRGCGGAVLLKEDPGRTTAWCRARYAAGQVGPCVLGTGVGTVQCPLFLSEHGESGEPRRDGPIPHLRGGEPLGLVAGSALFQALLCLDPGSAVP